MNGDRERGGAAPPRGEDEPRGYDEVRAALRERGYLETRLDRLFAGNAFDPRARSLRGQIVSALYAALLAGPPLGALLAIVLVLEGRGSVPAWPDGVLYALLFMPVLGALVGVAEAVAGLAIRALGRKRPSLSPRTAALVAGLAVAGALAAYLGVWWVRGGGAFTLRDLGGLVVLAAGAGFAGRVVSAAALVQATLAVGRAPLRRRPRTVLLMLALTLLVAGAVAGGTALATHEENGVPVRRAAQAPARALLVGWDGLSLELARGLRREGIPLAPAGGQEIALESGEAPDPVVAWTTVATGCPPKVHGIGGVELTALAGADAPLPRSSLASGPLDLLSRLWPVEQRVVRSGVRRTPAVWEVTADATRTAVIGWWGTWPATSPGRSGGYVVSDGALAALRRGRGVGEAIYPPGWGTDRAPRWLAAADAAAEEALRLAAAGARERAPAGWGEILAEALVADLFALEALGDALQDPEVRAAFVYLPGLDIVRERGRRERIDPFTRLDAIATHAGRVAPALARVLGALGDDALTGLAALPGRAGEGEVGFLRLHRAATSAMGEARETTDLDAVAPTWLAAAGYTIDARMTGPVRGDVTGPLQDVARVLTRARPVATRTPEEALEGDVLDRLRSLGYVR